MNARQWANAPIGHLAVTMICTITAIYFVPMLAILILDIADSIDTDEEQLTITQFD